MSDNNKIISIKDTEYNWTKDYQNGKYGRPKLSESYTKNISTIENFKIFLNNNLRFIDFTDDKILRCFYFYVRGYALTVREMPDLTDKKDSVYLLFVSACNHDNLSIDILDYFMLTDAVNSGCAFISLNDYIVNNVEDIERVRARLMGSLL